MRIRTIKPEFFTHEGLYELEKETGLPIRVAFAGIWCAADKAGRFKWEPRRIGVSILPYDNVDFSRVMDALFTRGYLVRYRVEDVDYGAVPAFSKHQFINNKEKESELPAPTLENLAEDDDKGKESKGRERIRRVSHATVTREPRVLNTSLSSIKGFNDEWEAFEIHRKKLKKPLTDRAVELTLRKLEERPQEAIAALQVAITKGWQSIEWDWFDKIKGIAARNATPIPAGQATAYDAKPEY